MAEGKKGSVKDVKVFFDTPERPMGMTEMKAEWINGGLTEKDKDEILTGLGNGTLTY